MLMYTIYSTIQQYIRIHHTCDDCEVLSKCEMNNCNGVSKISTISVPCVSVCVLCVCVVCVLCVCVVCVSCVCADH